ncbi:PREDICTED: protein phosphatase 2C 77-like [Ipomoea nil]|uniref:protein phosphatase 2C 77-like n=1 Tax=Ipomoea nil TaxID=35883 RepID=UPI000901B05B|nr:PREDICTED: protein phosphatase 2C 77-like [Ipomoea nil]XP_019192264.1 PREDICTED: protein phosphatase 2C 77-like [Ipomoea nil]
MEEVPFKPGSLVYDESVLPSCMDINGIELIANTSLLSEPTKVMLPLVSIANASVHYNCRVPRDGFDHSRMADLQGGGGEKFVSEMVITNMIDETFEGHDLMTGERIAGSILSSSEKGCAALEVSFAPDIGGFQNIKKAHSWDSAKMSELVSGLVPVPVNGLFVGDSKRKLPPSLLEVSKELKLIRQHAFAFDSPPLWGLTSICGKRPEMEDAAVALPRFSGIPSRMLMDVPIASTRNQNLTAHVFGVYDGHGGSQVANYCCERLHLALAEEVDIVKEDLRIESVGGNWKEQWEKALLSCFQKVDDEIGGTSRIDGGEVELGFPPIAPEAVGSTAVVAILCPTNIIVANCGDSRAVLCRGKLPMPLSVDHKPNREDEYSRIEALGGKVINWDGHRVSGVLAVSRSIGDRYLRPYVIPVPEIMFVPRAKEDECLVLASDGLWDVMTNEEVCDVARRRLLLWHKKNGGTMLSRERSDDPDPAAQDAAEYLTRIALQRGSRDNISVIVVDLKAQRKFKKKA